MLLMRVFENSYWLEATLVLLLLSSRLQATAVLVHIVYSLDRGIAIVGLTLARMHADTFVGAGGFFICFGQNSSLLLLLCRRRP